MSTRYQKPFTIPEGFPALLKAFTREILRSQPANIYEFGARYFADLVEQQARQEDAKKPSSSQQPLSGSLSSRAGTQPSEQRAASTSGSNTAPQSDGGQPKDTNIEAKLDSMFLSMDPDQTGAIHRADFETILYDGTWNLSDEQVMQIISEVCSDDSETIEYGQVLPSLAQYLGSL